MAKPNHILVRFEAVFEMDADVGEAIRDTVEQLRSQAAGRAVSYEIITDEAYQYWYTDQSHFLHEIEVPIPQVIRFD